MRSTKCKACFGHDRTARTACSNKSGHDFRIIEDGVSPAIEFDAFGEHLGAHATPIAGDRVQNQFELGTTHARLTSLLAGVRPGTGSTRAACVWGHVPPRWCEVTSSANTPSPVRTNRATPSGWRQAPRPSTSVADLEDAVDVGSTPSAVGQPLHGLGQLGQPVHARATLAGPLPLHVPHDIRHLGEWADVTRQRHDHAGAERRAGAAGGLLRDGESPRKRCGGDPGASVATEQEGAGRARSSSPIPAAAHREASSAASTTRVPPGRLTVSSMVPGFRRAHPSEPVRSEAGNEGHVGQRLDVLHQGGAASNPALADAGQPDKGRHCAPPSAESVDDS